MIDFTPNRNIREESLAFKNKNRSAYSELKPPNDRLK
jgi:hypothetical protein